MIEAYQIMALRGGCIYLASMCCYASYMHMYICTHVHTHYNIVHVHVHVQECRIKAVLMYKMFIVEAVAPYICQLSSSKVFIGKALAT